MKRANARSNCSSSNRRRGVATSRTAWRSRAASPCWTATSISRIDACSRASSRPVDSGRVLAPPHFAEPFGRLVSEAPAGGVGWLPLA
jgi:hypothetical protein